MTVVAKDMGEIDGLGVSQGHVIKEKGESPVWPRERERERERENMSMREIKKVFNKIIRFIYSIFYLTILIIELYCRIFGIWHALWSKVLVFSLSNVKSLAFDTHDCQCFILLILILILILIWSKNNMIPPPNPIIVIDFFLKGHPNIISYPKKRSL